MCRGKFRYLLLLLPLVVSACNTSQQVQVGTVSAWVETALTDEQRGQGLMGRTSLERDHGMLFVFPKSKLLKFWMLNTLVPLDVGFFDQQGRLLNIEQMQPDGGKQIYVSRAAAVYALEMNIGWFEHHGLQPGVRLRLPQSLAAP